VAGTLAALVASGEPLLVACADARRRRGHFAGRLGGLRVAGWHALERDPGLIDRYAHVLALDPPASDAQAALVDERFTLAWGEAEREYALRATKPRTTCARWRRRCIARCAPARPRPRRPAASGAPADPLAAARSTPRHRPPPPGAPCACSTSSGSFASMGPPCGWRRRAAPSSTPPRLPRLHDAPGRGPGAAGGAAARRPGGLENRPKAVAPADAGGTLWGWPPSHVPTRPRPPQRRRRATARTRLLSACRSTASRTPRRTGRCSAPSSPRPSAACSATSSPIVEEHADDAAVEIDRERVEDAFLFSCEHHADQRRKSGEEFIVHPVGVAKICAGMRLDTETLCAALLHDTVEDTSASLDEVRERFGDEVATLVDGVTKLTGITFTSRDEAQAENYRKMMVAMATDIRVILIKLADRLHNMRTIGALPKQKQIDKAKETLEIYAPIAHRLGIHAIKWELEDLAFAALHPRKYQEIKGLVNQQREEREDYVQTSGDRAHARARRARHPRRDRGAGEALLFDLLEDDQEGP
jgi:hypothetical protein